MSRLVLPVLILLAIAFAVAAAWYVVDRGFRIGDGAAGGEVTSEQRTLPPFTRLEVGGIADITLVQGDTEAIRYEASGKGERVRVEVRDGTLHIDSPSSRGFFGFLLGGGSRAVRATITFRKLEKVDVSGAVKLRAEGWKADRLAFTVSGEGTLRIEGLDVKELVIAVSGTVKAEIAGRAAEQRIAISGAGNYRAPELASDSAKVAVSGAGKVLVNVAKTLKIAIAGAGTVEYIGDPKVTQDISGVGRVRRREAAREALPAHAIA
jgi:Putative auto-transporter adhesin, head GIN domain